MRDYFRNRQVLGSIRQLDVVVPVFTREYVATSNTKLLLHLNGNSTDSSGNGNDGIDSYINYDYAYGKFNQGANFTKSPKSVIRTKNNIGISGSSPRTVSVWVKSLSSTDNMEMFGWGVESNSRSFSLMGRKGGSIYFYANNNDWDTGVILGEDMCNIILTYDGSNLKLYINGQLKASTTKSLNTTDTTFKLGERASVASYTSNGNIDEVIVENIAWSPSKVQEYYTSTL